MSDVERDSLLRQFQRSVCDCVTLTPVVDGGWRVEFPCLKAGPAPLRLLHTDHPRPYLLSDDGQIAERLEACPSAEQSRHLLQQVVAAAAQFGVRAKSRKWQIEFTLDDAGLGISALFQFLSRCDVLLRSDTGSFPRVTTRDEVLRLLKDLAGPHAERVLAHARHPGDDLGGFAPIRCPTNPPWLIVVIESDEDAQHALSSIQRQRHQVPGTRSLALYQNQRRIDRHLVARLTDEVDRQVSSIHETDRIQAILREILATVA